ncbi:hypothetical protein LTR84_007028 [Exophiala bonariae]|uniref:Autophagy-related protein 14 n=1 Tax=Exophiala bonariae TaxID=1690606 RepID=A0AAV9N2K7_9EURO|nr:hypothetical protein LTR84_007028 [Exophiala bonariae]
MSERDPSGRNERPFLYPWNRRLRHLHGISLRNVHVTSTSPKAKGKTTADDDAPYNLVSPAKRALQNDTTPLHHSRSFSDLITSAESPPNPLSRQKAATSYQKNDTPTKTRPEGRLRRRSTLHWTSATPQARQAKLEDMVVNRLADAWISIHAPGVDEPIYITEVIERSMNPSFASFDLDSTGPLISRFDQCIVRAWARPTNAEEYCLLVELDVNLRSLQYIGRNLENFHHPLPQNCILLHLSDGIYTSFTDLPADYPINVLQHKNQGEISSRPSSSFDALMQLANLDECIQDAVKVRSQLEADINKILEESREGEGKNDGDTAIIDVDESQIKAALATEQKQVRQLKKRRDEMQESLVQRRKAHDAGREDEAEARRLIEEKSLAHKEVEAARKDIEKESIGQIRRICECLLVLFPIEPIKSRTLQFTIRGIHLPNSVYNDTNRDEIAAALGFTGQLVYQLSLYLSVPLPYPVEPYGSASYITDPISVGLSQRRYPLHPTSVPYKFEYGVFLLNKDIEFLMSKSGLRVLDIRHTLPNLKYLLYVLTAGTGELPARKAGGVRGLLMGGRLTPDIPRRTSEDSIRSQPMLVKRNSTDLRTKANGSPREKVDGTINNDPFVSTSPIHGLPHRFHIPRIQDQ